MGSVRWIIHLDFLLSTQASTKSFVQRTLLFPSQPNLVILVFGRKFLSYCFSPNKEDYTIKDDLIVMKWEGSNFNPSYTSFTPLKGKNVNDDGFLVECLNFYFWNADSCDLQTGYNGVANSKGDTNFAIAKCDHPSHNCEYVDVYGIPGMSGAGAPQDFRDGRSYRLDTTPAPQKIFDINSWVVKRGATASECDPGRRTPPSPPAPSAPSAPRPPRPPTHYGPSKGGKGKGKYWLRN